MAFEHFKFPGLLSLFLLTASAISFLSSNQKSVPFGGRWKVWHSITLFLFFIASIIWANFEFGGIKANASYLFIALFKSIGVIIACAFCWLSAFFTGRWINKTIKQALIKTNSVFLETSFGLVVQCTFLLLIAAVGLLNIWIVLPFLLVPFALSYKDLGGTFSNLFNASLFSKKTDHWSGSLFFTILLFFLAINFVTNLAPFPGGFDSRNYYINICSLLEQNQGLIEGFQPYPWSLYLSLGFVVFKSSYVTLMLSFSSFIICLLGLYELCTHHLNLTKNRALLVLMLVSMIPAVANHMFIELKVDFGLLIFQIASILVLFDFIKLHKSIAKNEQTQLARTDWIRFLILFGVMCGFATSIKVINLYLVFSFAVIVWTIYYRYLGFLFMFMFLMGITIIGDFDAISGLREYHLSMDSVKWVLTGVGGIGLIFLWFRDLPKGITLVKHASIYSIVLLLMMSPWIGKNYIETKSLSPSKLLIGKSAGPGINMKTMVKTYNQSKKK